MTIDDSSERQPLLGASDDPPVTPSLIGFDGKRRLGPLEISPATRRAILAGVWLGSFLSALNQTLVATLLSSISSEFQSSNQASWLGSAYLLATCTFTPLYGRLSNVLGRKGANLLALILTGVGTLGCGLSTNMPMLIVARFCAGFGGGGLFTTSSIIISDMYSMRDRSMTAGIAAVFNGLGMGLGGPLGGMINDTLGWRWAFLLQLPLFFASFVLTARALNYVTPGKGRSHWDALKRIDYAGTLTLLLAAGSYLGFLSLHYNGDYDLHHPLVIATLSVAIGVFVIFVVVELCVANEPVLAPFLLRQRVPVLVGLSNLLVAQCNFTVMYLFPLWFQSVQLTSASEAGLHLFPNAAAMSLGSLFAGWMMKKTGKYKALNVIFGIFPTTAAVMIANLGVDSGWWSQWITIIPLGFGNAVVLQTTLIALLASIDPAHVAVGTGFGQLFRGIGQVSGVATSSALFQSLLLGGLRSRITGPDSEEIIQRLRHSVKAIIDLPPDLQLSARKAYGDSLHYVFLFAACSTFAAFIIRLWIPELSLDRHTKGTAAGNGRVPPQTAQADVERQGENERTVVEESEDDDEPADIQPLRRALNVRRLSTYESDDGKDPDERN